MDKRPYVSTDGNIYTDLQFTKPQIYLAMQAFVQYITKQPYFERFEIEELQERSKRQCAKESGMLYDISIVLHFDKKLKKMIENKTNWWKLYNDKETEKAKDYISFDWTLERDGKWYMDRYGKSLCGKRYLDIMGGKESFDTCPKHCPKEYVKICNGLTEIAIESSKIDFNPILKRILKNSEF